MLCHPPRAVTRFVVNPARLMASGEFDTTATLTISRNGARIAFLARDAAGADLQLYVRELSALDYFARVLDESPDAERLEMLRERIEYFLHLPEPSRSEELAELDRAVLALDQRGAWRVTATWLNILMELPNEALVAGLRARLAAYEALDPEARKQADWMLDMVITQELLSPQRVRVRDTLSMLGHERPTEVPDAAVPEGPETPAGVPLEVDEMLVLAESNGKEISVPKNKVRERRESESSLMPENFADAIPQKDFNHLLAFLLSKSVKP